LVRNALAPFAVTLDLFALSEPVESYRWNRMNMVNRTLSFALSKRNPICPHLFVIGDRKMRPILKVVLGTCLIVLCSGAGRARADDNDTIDYRQHIMKTMDEQMAAIEMIRLKQVDSANLPVHLKVLALSMSTALTAFEPAAPGGRANPDIWRNWKDFRARAQALAGRAGELAQLTDGAAITAALEEKPLSQECSGCHDIYRNAAGSNKPPAGDVKSNAIRYRTLIMETLNEQSKALGMILATTIPDDNAQAHLAVIALTASIALNAFKGNVQGGESKPAIWTNWPDFSKRMMEFAAGTAGAEGIGKSLGVKAGLDKMSDALTCKQCHDVYRDDVPDQ
jgi:cytochrome c556